MDPLRAALGAAETAREAARRLRAPGVLAAPVVRRGKVAGILTRQTAEAALRHGAGDLPCGLLVTGGAPRIGAGSVASRLSRASRGVAPGVLVEGVRGIVAGIVLKDRLEPALGVPVRDLRGALESGLGPARREMLAAARRIAARRRAGLYLAGGVVRDLLAGERPADLDLVVEGNGLALAGDLAAALGGRITRHGRFGTSVVTIPGAEPIRIDVATARREVYDRPGALPRVSDGGWLDDLLRRDFTINSMAIRLAPGPAGRLLDPLNGAGDLRRGILRSHHRLAFVEDPTRAYRLARFAARFGFAPDPGTLEGLQLAHRLGAFDAVGGQRLRHEIDLVAAEPDPAAALRWCVKLDLLPRLGPGLRLDARSRGWVVRLTREIRTGALRGEGLGRGAGLLILMLLSLRAGPRRRESLIRRLGIAGEGGRRLLSCGATLAALRRALSGAPRPSRVARACEAVPIETLAAAIAVGPSDLSRQVRRYLDELRRLRSPVDGTALRAMGLPPGPAFGDILARLRSALLDGIAPNPADQQQLARRLVAERLERAPRGR